MATYKLIQDVEAEDHILGPLTLRQFIFALIGVFGWYMSFIIFVRHVYFVLAITVPPAIFFTFFAIPFGRDQPTEIWFLAKLRFWFKPRQRIWDQSGVKQLVTVTVPKKIERVLTKGYSQTEVQSRLTALANTLDTRGWAIKDVNARPYTPPADRFSQSGSDRLIDISAAPEEVPSYDARASDDILDETSNPVAQQFQTMINQSTEKHRQRIINEMNKAKAQKVAPPPPSDENSGGWFMNHQAGGPPVSPAPQSSSTSLSISHLRTLQPIKPGGQAAKQQTPAAHSPSGTPPPDPAILSLANNNDLNVSTIARQAYKAKYGDEPPRGEVVVSLH